MRIGVLGSGLMGGKLGAIFARAGHEIVFSYARREEKLTRLAWAAGAAARAGAPREATQGADALLLAVHWSRIDDVLKQAGDLSGKVIVTCCLPLNPGNTELVVGRASSGAEELAKKAPRARIVSAFHTVPSEVLFDVFERKLARPSLVYSGDEQSSKAIAAALIRDAGFDPVDAGPLKSARYSEPFGLLVGHLAYNGSGGPELAYRFERECRPISLIAARNSRSFSDIWFARKRSNSDASSGARITPLSDIFSRPIRSASWSTMRIWVRDTPKRSPRSAKDAGCDTPSGDSRPS